MKASTITTTIYVFFVFFLCIFLGVIGCLDVARVPSTWGSTNVVPNVWYRYTLIQGSSPLAPPGSWAQLSHPTACTTKTDRRFTIRTLSGRTPGASWHRKSVFTWRDLSGIRGLRVHGSWPMFPSAFRLPRSFGGFGCVGLGLRFPLPALWHPRPLDLVPGSLKWADLLSALATPVNLGWHGNTRGNHPPPSAGDGGLIDEGASVRLAERRCHNLLWPYGWGGVAWRVVSDSLT